MVKQLLSINNFLILLIFFCTGLTIAVAQESDTEIHIKIEKEIDGEKQTIDKTFTNPNDPELKALLKDNDMHIKSKDMDIDVGVEIEEEDAGNHFNIQLDTDDPKSVEQFKQQVQQLADDMGIDIDISQGNKKEMQIFKYMPDDANFDMNKLFENLDEDIKEWIDIEELKDNLSDKLKNSDFDINNFYNSTRPMMGVTIKDLEEGILIENVSDEMGAEEAGLESGDIIKYIDGEKMENVDQIIEYIADKEAGDFIEVKYEREGKTKKVDVELKVNDRFKNRNWKLDNDGSKKFKFDSDDFDTNSIRERMEEMMENAHVRNRTSITICILDEDEKAKLDSFSPNAKLSPLSDDEIGKIDQTFKFSPNPSKGIFNLRFTSDESAQIQINIYDMSGKEIYTESINNFDGSFDKDIDISGSEGGAYILEIVKDNKRLNKKIIIE